MTVAYCKLENLSDIPWCHSFRSFRPQAIQVLGFRTVLQLWLSKLLHHRLMSVHPADRRLLEEWNVQMKIVVIVHLTVQCTIAKEPMIEAMTP